MLVEKEPMWARPAAVDHPPQCSNKKKFYNINKLLKHSFFVCAYLH